MDSTTDDVVLRNGEENVDQINGTLPSSNEYSQVEILTHHLNIDKKDFLNMLGVMNDDSFEREFEINDKFARQINNKAGGYAFPVNDMTLLKRFLVLGYEYFCTDGENDENRMDEITDCVKNLMNDGKHNEVLNLLVDLSEKGRVIKQDSILFVLSILVAEKPKSDEVLAKYETTEAEVYEEAYENANPDKAAMIKELYKKANAYEAKIRKAAYEKVNTICNIPTKLFRFIELSQNCMIKVRKTHPTVPQKMKKETKKEPTEDDENSSDSNETTKVKKGMAWGRLRRNAIAKFYTDESKDPVNLLYLLTKYKKRFGWSHKQVMKYAHPKIPPGINRDASRLVLMYCSKGYKKFKEEVEKLERSAEVEKVMKLIEIINEVQNLNKDKNRSVNENEMKRLVEILQQHGCPENDDGSGIDLAAYIERENKHTIIKREHLPTQFLREVKVWEALLKDMPMTAMIRNLTKMASLGMFDEKEEEDKKENIEFVKKVLSDSRRLKKACIHPMTIHHAKEIYKEGKKKKEGKLWYVNSSIKNALDSAFYNCFRKAEIADCHKSGKKFMLFLDMSIFKDAAPFYKVAAVAMIMIIWNVEEKVEIIGYHSRCIDLTKKVSKEMTIEEAIKALKIVYDTENMAFQVNENETAGSAENVAPVYVDVQRTIKRDIPIRYAFQKRIEVDCFILLTSSNLDNVRIPHVIALRMYNHTMQRTAKLIVCELSSSNLSIGDSKDPNCLDVVGFDSRAPEIIQRFARHDIV